MHNFQDLSFPTRDWTQGQGSESDQSSPLDHQGIPFSFYSLKHMQDLYMEINLHIYAQLVICIFFLVFNWGKKYIKFSIWGGRMVTDSKGMNIKKIQC